MFLHCNFVFLFLCWVCTRQCPYPQDCILNWSYGKQINYNCAELPAGRHNYSKRVLDSGSWESLQLSSKSAVNLQLTYSRNRGACKAIRSHVASRRKYLQATCIAPRGTSEWLSLHTVEIAITPSFTPHWPQVMSVDTHLSARRE